MKKFHYEQLLNIKIGLPHGELEEILHFVKRDRDDPKTKKEMPSIEVCSTKNVLIIFSQSR
jgi:hypothetical protein